jgi:ankyrin repeat protein
MEGQTNAVQALLDNNSDINTVDLNGDSLLNYAILGKGNALLYVIMLTEKGIDVNIRNNDGDTALILAAKNGAKENIRLIQKLLESNSDSGILNNKGQSFFSVMGEEAKKSSAIQEEEEGLINQTKHTNKKSSQNVFYIYLLMPLVILFVLKIANILMKF